MPAPLKASKSGNVVLYVVIGLVVIFLLVGGAIFAYKTYFSPSQLSAPSSTPALPTVSKPPTSQVPTPTPAVTGLSNKSDTTDTQLAKDGQELDQSLTTLGQSSTNVDAGMSDSNQGNTDLQNLSN